MSQRLTILTSCWCLAISAFGLDDLKFRGSEGDTTTCTNGPCGPGNDQCGEPFDQTSPQFHIRDNSCGENDPNFPLYDARFKKWHHFWQAHLAEPGPHNEGRGPDIGHAVSDDLIYWSHLPVAVWNDQLYDNVAIYTGSATIVNGLPTMVYPGLCVKSDWPTCDTGTVFAIAVPANLSDPLLTNWSKPAYNPIVENVQRDPSTSWQTAAGEWRFTNYEGKIYSSLDFVSWTVAGDGTAIFPTAECPDFFPVPSYCKGNGCTNTSNKPQPTHIHKQSSGGQDWYTLGTYVEGAVGTTGTWTPLPNVPLLQPLDASALTNSGMTFYASKSMFDPVQSRRLYYGWALVPPASSQTLARVTEYHAGLQQLVFNPLPELSALRALPPLFTAPSLTLAPNTSMWLGDWANSVGNQSEFGGTFMLAPSSTPESTTTTSAGYTTFGINVMVSAAGDGSNTNISTGVEVSFDPISFTANVTVGAHTGRNISYYMIDTDLPGGDYNVTNVNYTDPHICQQVCTNDPNCVAYTYVVRPPLVGSCCLKGDVPNLNPSATCTSGVKPGHQPPRLTGVPIPLLKGEDTAIDIRVFVDNTFLEVFIMGGRVAFTVPLSAGTVGNGVAGMTLFTTYGNGVTVSNVNAWHMNSIWVDL